MALMLTPHPETPCTAVRAIAVAAARGAGGALTLRYAVSGEIAALRLPPQAAPTRAEGLWRSTCFEAFLRAPGDEAYIELNFSPSTQWAAYAFGAYRAGMREAEIAAPAIAPAVSAERLEVSVSAVLPMLANEPRWRLALSAVIEDANGAKSYWALAHAPTKPDFHHRDGFTLDLTERT